MFPVKTKTALTTTMPIKSGRSLFNPASVKVDPNPGYEKTCSAKTDPPNSSPK